MRERTKLVHTAHSLRQAPKATAKRTTTDVKDRLASLGAPDMPEYLAAKVTDAIAAESARRGFDTKASRRRRLVSAR
jgi:hypothetical protein